jgi:hypothetical protein
LQAQRHSSDATSRPVDFEPLLDSDGGVAYVTVDASSLGVASNPALVHLQVSILCIISFGQY